jgi:cell division septal protein FtsQ
LNKGRKAVTLISVILLAGSLIFVAFELFQVREISVAGCATRDAAQVAALSGLTPGQCIFFVNTEKVKDSLKSNPIIDPVSVTIVYPYTVAIEIRERTPAGYIDADGVRLTIDSEAVLLSVDTTPEGEVAPMVTGISTDRFEVGQPLGDDAYKRKVFSDLLSALADSNLKIVGIDLTYTSSVKLQTNAGLIIQLGNGDALATKLSLADYAVSELFKQGKGTGTLDVSTGVNAYYREN